MNKKYDFYYLTFTWIDKIQLQSQQRGLSLSDGNFGTSFFTTHKKFQKSLCYVISNTPTCPYDLPYEK